MSPVIFWKSPWEAILKVEDKQLCNRRAVSSTLSYVWDNDVLRAGLLLLVVHTSCLPEGHQGGEQPDHTSKS